MPRVEIKGIHRVRRKLANGKTREHHYAWRGGPKFWQTGSDIELNTPEYVAALAEVSKRPKTSQYMASDLVADFLESGFFKAKKPSTQKDYRKWATRFGDEFKSDPAAMFQDPRSRGEVNQWRQNWSHSPRQYDHAGTTITLLLNWARNEGRILEHHCDKLPKLYESDRAEIIWTPGDITAFNQVAPPWVCRILGMATETGLRPGDLVQLTRNQVEITGQGRRLKVRTNKRGRLASIPVTPELGRLIDATPAMQLLLLVSANGKPLTEEHASKSVKYWARKAKLPDELRLYDARGTAATRLLRADLSLNQIAIHMGWSLRHAANVIETYAAVSGGDSEDVLLKIEAHRKRGEGNNEGTKR